MAAAPFCGCGSGAASTSATAVQFGQSRTSQNFLSRASSVSSLARCGSRQLQKSSSQLLVRWRGPDLAREKTRWKVMAAQQSLPPLSIPKPSLLGDVLSEQQIQQFKKLALVERPSWSDLELENADVLYWEPADLSPGSTATIVYAPPVYTFKASDLLFVGGVNGDGPSLAALVQRIKRGDADRQIYEFEVKVPIGAGLLSFFFTDGEKKDDKGGALFNVKVGGPSAKPSPDKISVRDLLQHFRDHQLELARIKVFFLKEDSDKDGKITLLEAAKVLSELTGPTTPKDVLASLTRLKLAASRPGKAGHEALEKELEDGTYLIGYTDFMALMTDMQFLVFDEQKRGFALFLDDLRALLYTIQNLLVGRLYVLREAAQGRIRKPPGPR